MLMENMITAIGLLVLIINIATMWYLFPRRYGVWITICILVLYTAAFYVITTLPMIYNENLPGIRGVLFLPAIIWLFKGRVMEKVFAFFFTYLITLWIGTIVTITNIDEEGAYLAAKNAWNGPYAEMKERIFAYIDAGDFESAYATFRDAATAHRVTICMMS